MITNRCIILLTILLLAVIPALPQQQKSDTAFSVPVKYIEKVETRAETYSKRIDRQTEKYLRRLEKQELKLQRKLARLDSTKAAQLFSGTKEKYAVLRSKLKSKTDGVVKGVYVPNLDSMGISLKFLGENSEWINGVKGKGEQCKRVSETFSQMKDKLSATDDIRQYIKDRKQLLKDALNENGLGKHLKKFSKEGYYYARQMQEYKEAWKDPAKMERKLLELLNRLPAFKKFAQENSQLAGLFGVPAGYGTAQSLAGLQTRAAVNAQIRTQIAASGPNAMQSVQQNLQQAQGQLNQLKDKLNKLGGNNSNVDIPDFVLNSQRTKSFWQRFEIKTDLQTNRGSRFLPNTADIAAGFTFKIDDKKQIGSQLVYKAGLGNGFNNIKLTHQGIGYRFYTDLKLKGSFWISAGYENNYFATFSNFRELEGVSNWQTSALAGISKKWKLKKKPSFAKATEGEMKILYDFLWNQKPGGQRVVWRTGLNF
ncbi:MAG: hypothetical protein JNM68_06335 [Dinghuibacter sp.]|nr:hypothetical protein [Dinghuibacter sp.]